MDINSQNKEQKTRSPGESGASCRNAYRIGFVLLDGFSLMSYSAAVEPLRAANLLAAADLYDIRHLPGDGAMATSSSGATVRASAWIGEQVDFDLVLIVAGGDPARLPYLRLMRWLRHLASRGVRLGGVSGGPVVLARAGVMEGRRMTVHWEHRDELASFRSTAIVERSLYVSDRDRLTCAGGTAPLDMMHALIREQHGAVFARRVSDWFLHVDVRPSEGPQRSGLAARHGTHNSALLSAIEAMENHLADPLDLDQLARLAGVGVRQLNRLSRQHLGQATVAFYRSLRLAKSLELLQRTGLSMSAIASATGFGTQALFATRFRQRYGVAPSRARYMSNVQPMH